MAGRSASTLLLAVILAATLGMMPGLHATPQTGKPRGDIELPPISWTCPMHPDVLEAGQGICPICKMNLVAVRLASIWTCPVHTFIAELKGGTCRIDHRDLVRMTVAVSWTCQGRSDIDQLTPARCPDGSEMVARYTQRPHGDHNPRHGGQFFMAPDNWHHLEGAYPRAGLIRIYLYDDYTKTLPLDQAKRVQGRIVTKETVNDITHATKEVAFPLTLARDGRYLEAKVDTRLLPAKMAAKVKFKTDAPEYRFDFVFEKFSKEPISPSSSNAPRDASAIPEPPSNPDFVASAIGLVPAGADPSQSLVIPDTVEGMVAEVSARNRQLEALIDRGAFAEVYVPAFQAKDLAIAIDQHLAQLPSAQQQRLEPILKRLVRSAWMLDAFGDLGNRQQIVEAYAGFRSAVVEIESVFRAGR